MNIPWDYILSGASGGAIFVIFAIIFLQKFLEKKVDNEFDKNLEVHKSNLNELLETHKAKMQILSNIRVDLLKDMWCLHKDILSGIYAILRELSVRISSNNQMFDEFVKSIKLRKEVTGNLSKHILDLKEIISSRAFLVSEEQIIILQKFINNCNSIIEMLEDKIDKKYLPSEKKIKEIWCYYYDNYVKTNENSPIEILDKETLINANIEDIDEQFIYHTNIGALKLIRTDYLASVAIQFNISDIAPWLEKSENIYKK